MSQGGAAALGSHLPSPALSSPPPLLACSFSAVGCAFNAILPNELAAHIKSDVHAHLALTLAALLDTRRQLDELRAKVDLQNLSGPSLKPSSSPSLNPMAPISSFSPISSMSSSLSPNDLLGKPSPSVSPRAPVSPRSTLSPNDKSKPSPPLASPNPSPLSSPSLSSNLLSSNGSLGSPALSSDLLSPQAGNNGSTSSSRLSAIRPNGGALTERRASTSARVLVPMSAPSTPMRFDATALISAVPALSEQGAHLLQWPVLSAENLVLAERPGSELRAYLNLVRSDLSSEEISSLRLLLDHYALLSVTDLRRFPPRAVGALRRSSIAAHTPLRLLTGDLNVDERLRASFRVANYPNVERALELFAALDPSDDATQPTFEWDRVASVVIEHVVRVFTVELTHVELSDPLVRSTCADQLDALRTLTQAVLAPLSALPRGLPDSDRSALVAQLDSLIPQLRQRSYATRSGLRVSLGVTALIEALCTKELFEEASAIASDIDALQLPSQPMLGRGVSAAKAASALRALRFPEARDTWRKLLSSGQRGGSDEKTLATLLETLRSLLAAARSAVAPVPLSDRSDTDALLPNPTNPNPLSHSTSNLLSHSNNNITPTASASPSPSPSSSGDFSFGGSPSTAQEAQRHYRSVLAEVEHYLSAYVHARPAIVFAVAESEWTLALRLCQQHQVKREVFVELVAEPCRVRGAFSQLRAAMHSLDPTLATFTPYLLALCAALNEAQQWRALVAFQLFMRDYTRAGLTCVKLFTHTATTPIQTPKTPSQTPNGNNTSNPSASRKAALTAAVQYFDLALKTRSEDSDALKYRTRALLQLELEPLLEIDPPSAYPGLLDEPSPSTSSSTSSLGESSKDLLSSLGSSSNLSNPSSNGNNATSLFGSKREQALVARWILLDPARHALAWRVLAHCRLEAVHVAARTVHYLAALPLPASLTNTSNPSLSTSSNPNSTLKIAASAEDEEYRDAKHERVAAVLEALRVKLRSNNGGVDDIGQWEALLLRVVHGAVRSSDHRLAHAYSQRLTLPKLKLDALLALGKHAAAYLEAVRLADSDAALGTSGVERVREAASARHDHAVERLCARFLEQRGSTSNSGSSVIGTPTLGSTPLGQSPAFSPYKR